MGKIKSALELAMEKTADLKTDKSAVKKKEISGKGKSLSPTIWRLRKIGSGREA